MRVRTTLTAVALAAVATLAAAGVAAADGNDDPVGTISQTAESGPSSDQGAANPFGGGKMDNGNWNNPGAFGPMTLN